MKQSQEGRLLNASELEIVSNTRSPIIETLSVEQLQAVTHRLRQAHDRAKDIGTRQAREMRGKTDPRGAKRAQDNTGSVAKARVLGEAIKRVDGELRRREESNQASPSQADLSLNALEMKLTAPEEHHPGGGRSAAPGMRVKTNKVPPKIGTTRKEIGRVSQAGKVAQARKDSAKR